MTVRRTMVGSKGVRIRLDAILVRLDSALNGLLPLDGSFLGSWFLNGEFSYDDFRAALEGVEAVENATKGFSFFSFLEVIHYPRHVGGLTVAATCN